MNYTYQEISESGNWSLPGGTDVHHATSKRQLRNALERWADTNDRYNDRRDAWLRVWAGHLGDVTDVYPEFDVKEGPRGGMVIDPC